MSDIGGISNSNMLRITGMATGMDTDEMIKKLMQAEQIKVDRATQKKQVTEWQQEAFRNVMNDLSEFQSKYFDVLSSDYMLSNENFSSTSSKINSGSSVDISTSSQATVGDYTVNVINKASNAQYQGTNFFNVDSVGKSNFAIKIDSNNDVLKVGSYTVDFALASGESNKYDSLSNFATAINNKLASIDAGGGQTASDKVEAVYNNEKVYFLNKTEIVEDSDPTKDNHNISVSYGGKTYSFTINKGTYNSFELANEINSKLQGATASDSTTFSNNNPDLKFVYNGDSDAFEIQDSNGVTQGSPVLNYKASSDTTNYTGVFSNSTATSLDYSSATFTSDNSKLTAGTNTLEFLDADKKIISGFNDTFSVTVGNVVHNVQLTAGTTKANIVSEINTALHDPANGNLSTNTLSVEADPDGKLIFKSTTGEQIRISGAAVGVLGISDNYELNQSNTEKMSNLISGAVAFDINGTSFNYDFSGVDADKTISDILNDISDKAGIDMKYNDLSKSFSMISKNTGATESIIANDSSGSFVQTLFGTSSINETGTDAEVQITDPSGSTKTLYKSTNKFTAGGVTYNTTSVGETKFSVSGDVSETFDKVKSFINSYNEIVSKLNAKLTEKKSYDYKPLTDSQKKAMSDDEITKWEDKAKEGLLHSDNIIETMLSRMRTAFYDKVNNSGINLWDVGLHTSSDISKAGIIEIDDEKLKSALENDPDKITKLFVGESNESYSSDAFNKTRYDEEGIFQRINDILKDNTRNTLDSHGKRGLLVEKAGVKGRYSEFNNILTNQIKLQDQMIKDLTDKLTEKENNYYQKFAKLESIMNKYNAQSNWLYQQLGQ